MPLNMVNIAVVGAPPDPISCKIATYPLGTLFPSQTTPWGKLLYAISGVAAFNIAGTRLLSPPAYGIWIPAGVEHSSTMLHASQYAKVFIQEPLCSGMPKHACTLALTNLIKAIVAEFARRNIEVPRSPEDMRLALVLLDQIRVAPRTESYLPFTQDALVEPLLTALQSSPGDRRSLAQWAAEMNTTERTLSRRFHAKLGLSFGEWRKRLRLLTALSLLESGQTVQDVARELRFSTTSAFIAAFRQLTGTSPGRMRDDIKAFTPDLIRDP